MCPLKRVKSTLPSGVTSTFESCDADASFNPSNNFGGNINITPLVSSMIKRRLPRHSEHSSHAVPTSAASHPPWSLV